MNAREQLRRRVEVYVEAHPDATLATVLGRFHLSPESEDRAVVEEILAREQRSRANTGGASA